MLPESTGSKNNDNDIWEAGSKKHLPSLTTQPNQTPSGNAKQAISIKTENVAHPKSTLESVLGNMLEEIGEDDRRTSEMVLDAWTSLALERLDADTFLVLEREVKTRFGISQRGPLVDFIKESVSAGNIKIAEGFDLEGMRK